MARRDKGQGGFAMLYVIMLMVALLLMLGFAYSMMYAAHKQNVIDRQELSVRSDVFSARQSVGQR